MIANFFYSLGTQVIELLYAVFPVSTGLPTEVFDAFQFIGGF